MQVRLDISTIFVEYAHFYVNAIMLTSETKFEDCFAYVANKNDFDDKTANYLHVSSLNSIDLSDEFTVVVIDYSQHTSSFVEFIQTLNLVDRYYLCACEDGFYMLVIDKKYKKKF